MWHQLQYEILQKTQIKNNFVKSSAILIIHSIYEKLDLQFITMLPELIPYLGELLEDDDNKVIDLTHELIKKIELISGEDLSTYLKN
jgi:U3 small nucleolar RNA-associated protein 10